MGYNDVSQSASFEIKDKHLQGNVIYILNQSAGAEFFFGKNLMSAVQITRDGVTLKIKTNPIWFNHTERDEKINIKEFVGDGDVKVEIFVWESYNNPTPFSPTKTFNVKGVEPEPEPCQSGYVRINGICLDPNACYCKPDEICNNGTCLTNNGAKKVIINQTFNSGAIGKPVTFVTSDVNIGSLKQDEHIISSRLYTKVIASRIGVSIADLFYTSQVKIDVNGQRKDSLNLEPELFNFNPQTKESDIGISVSSGKNTIKYELDFGLANIKYQLYSDIVVKLNTGRVINISVNNKVEDLDEGEKFKMSLQMPLIILGAVLIGAVVLSTSGGRTVVYRGAKAGYKRLRK